MPNQSTKPELKALGYLERGWPLIPLYETKGGQCACNSPDCASPGKHPRTKNGCKDASDQPLVICQWWNHWPNANIGVATGPSSGIAVVDIDPRHGGDKSWKEFSVKYLLPPTLSVNTGGGGLHLYYKYPTQGIRNKTNLLPGIDIRGEGGYIVAPPSIHASGDAYQWANGLPILEFPSELLELANAEKKIKKNSAPLIKNGTRNSTLFSLASLLRRQGMESSGIQSALIALNHAVCEEPLPDHEIHSISRSVTKYKPLHVVVENELKWPVPQPLPSMKKQVSQMGADYLPEALRPRAADICERMQIPLEFIAAPTVVSLSSVIGRKLGIHPKKKDDWLVVPNLWGGVIARPGFFKSPAITEAFKPLEALIKQERVKYQAAVIVAKSKEDVIKAKIDGLKENVKKSVRKGNQQELEGLEYQLAEALKELESISVTEKRFKTNDATIEKIGALLVENPDGIMIVRDELAGWLKTLEKTGREGDREFFLESWNGYGSFTVDRIGRGTLHIPSLCLSIFGGLQPGKLDAYINQALYSGAGDDGLLQRFQLLFYPEMLKTWKNIDRRPNEEARAVVFDLFERIAALPSRNEENQSALHFSGEAQEIFNDWREKFEHRLRQEDCETPAFESHLSKYRSLLPSLALIFQLCQGPKEIEKVGTESIQLALRWVELLEAHAKKVYASIIQSDLAAAQALAKKISSGAIQDGATVRSIYRKHWSSIETPKQVDKALSVLEDLGWLAVHQVKVNFGTKDEIRLNPKLNQQ